MNLNFAISNQKVQAEVNPVYYKNGNRGLQLKTNLDKNIRHIVFEQYRISEKQISALPAFPDGKHVADAIMYMAEPLERTEPIRPISNPVPGAFDHTMLLNKETNVVVIRAQVSKSTFFDIWTIVVYID